jgi:manganese transport system substrate-binding protein
MMGLQARQELLGRLARALGWGLACLGTGLQVGCGFLSPQGLSDLLADPDVELKRDGRPLVITSFTVPKAMAEAVSCSRLQVESLLAPGTEIHAHQPGKRELNWLQQADLILVHGLGLHPWLPPLLDQVGPRPTADVAAGLRPRLIPAGVRAGQPDPHAWMSPRRAQTYVANIRDAFIAFDPQHADTYRSCASRYSAQLRQIDQQLQRELSRIPPRRRVLVSCEGSLGYLSDDYGLEELYLWPSQGEPKVDPARLRQITARVRERQIPALFCESTYRDNQQRQLAQQAGASFGGTLYVDSLSSLDGLAPNYIEMLKHNAYLIEKGLSQVPPPS